MAGTWDLEVRVRGGGTKGKNEREKCMGSTYISMTQEEIFILGALI